MYRLLLAFGLLLVTVAAAMAGVQPFPAGFRAQQVATNGTILYVRVGGQGPGVVLLHC
jgi:hypothetical protein